jgi:hypothetical protein
MRQQKSPMISIDIADASRIKKIYLIWEFKMDAITLCSMRARL